MKAQVTLYIKPEDQNAVVKDLKSILGDNIKFLSNDLKYLSWIGEASVDVTNQKDAFLLERDLHKINKLIDVEVIVEESSEEDDINLRFDLVNEALNLDKEQYPHPYWYHHAVHLTEALAYANKAFINGEGFFDAQNSQLKIGMIDTGYTGHPEIAFINKEQGQNLIPWEDREKPIDTLENTRPIPIRWGGHGTSCSGLVIGHTAKITSENRIPKRGVYFDDLVDGLLPLNINLIPYRVSKNIISFSSRMAEAINLIVENGTIPVISMSHASLKNRPIYYAAVREAYEKGIILVAAPGSHVFGPKRVFTYPAKYEETIAPAASTFKGDPWKLTHGGPEVDICAPGFEIYIPFPYKEAGKGGRVGYGYKWSEGSSFAVPIVATAAALWLMHHGPGLQSFAPTEQVELFRSIIKTTATPFKDPSIGDIYGKGVINFERMLQHPLPKIIKSRADQPVLTPEKLFRVNKKEASFKRELIHLKSMQYLKNQSKAMSEIDFYFTKGTEGLKSWINKKIKSGADSEMYLEKLIESLL